MARYSLIRFLAVLSIHLHWRLMVTFTLGVSILKASLESVILKTEQTQSLLIASTVLRVKIFCYSSNNLNNKPRNILYKCSKDRNRKKQEAAVKLLEEVKPKELSLQMVTLLLLGQTFPETMVKETICHQTTTTVQARVYSMLASRNSNHQSQSIWLRAYLTQETIRQWSRTLCLTMKRQKILNFSYSNLLRELNKLSVDQSTLCSEPTPTGSFLVVMGVHLLLDIKPRSLAALSDRLNSSMGPIASSLLTVQMAVFIMYLSRQLHVDLVIAAVWHKMVQYMFGDFQVKFQENKMRKNFLRNASSKSQLKYRLSTASKETLAPVEASQQEESQAMEIQVPNVL